MDSSLALNPLHLLLLLEKLLNSLAYTAFETYNWVLSYSLLHTRCSENMFFECEVTKLLRV